MKIKMILFGCVKSRDAFFENLGIERIVPYLRSYGYEVEYEYLFMDMPMNDLKQKLKCDIAGFSFYPDTYEFASMCIKEVKKFSGKVIVGGKYATDNYSDMLRNIEGIDAICLGHGEIPLHNLLEMLSRGVPLEECIKDIPFFVCRNKRKEDVRICISNINELSLPDRDKYIKVSRAKELFICDSHGCTGNCTFCSNCQNMRRYSSREPEDILNEVKNLNKLYGITQFNLTSNSFEDPGKKGKEKIRKFCNILLNEKLNISLGCYIRGNFIKNEEDKELLDKMVQAGFTHIFIGVETANNDDLLLYGKQARQSDTDTLLNYLKKHSQKTFASYGFIMINPFSTMEHLKENYKFLSDNNCCVFENYISVLYVYTETKMYKICQQEGVLLSDFDSLHPLSYEIRNSEVREINSFFASTLQPLQKKLGNTVDILRNIYGIRRFIKPNSSIDNRLFSTIDSISILLKEYFSHIFVELDIDYCTRVYDDWASEMYNQYKQMHVLFMKYKMEFAKSINGKES